MKETIKGLAVDGGAVQRFGANLKARGKQPATIESYCRDAQRFLDYLHDNKMAVSQVEPATLLAYQNYLRHELEERDNSIRRTIIGVRQFFRYLSQAHTIPSSPFDDVPIPSRDDDLRRGVRTEQVTALLAAARGGVPECKAARDTALVALLAFEGLKVNEIITLRWRDYVGGQERGLIRISGTRARAIHVSEETNRSIKDYKNAYDKIQHPVLVNDKERRIFIAFKGREASVPLSAMTRHGVKFILYDLGEKIGYKKLNTEQLRHFAIQHLISLAKSPEDIMAHLGLRRAGLVAKHFSKQQRTVEGATRA